MAVRDGTSKAAGDLVTAVKDDRLDDVDGSARLGDEDADGGCDGGGAIDVIVDDDDSEDAADVGDGIGAAIIPLLLLLLLL